jgi:hypothetical protein
VTITAGPTLEIVAIAGRASVPHFTIVRRLAIIRVFPVIALFTIVSGTALLAVSAMPSLLPVGGRPDRFISGIPYARGWWCLWSLLWRLFGLAYLDIIQ